MGDTSWEAHDLREGLRLVEAPSEDAHCEQETRKEDGPQPVVSFSAGRKPTY